MQYLSKKMSLFLGLVLLSFFSCTSHEHRQKRKCHPKRYAIKINESKQKNKFNTSENVMFPTVSIYTVSWCTGCKSLQKFLKIQKIPFKNFDIEENDNAQNRFLKLQKKFKFDNSIPKLFINGEYIDFSSYADIKKAFERHQQATQNQGAPSQPVNNIPLSGKQK